MFMDDNRYPKLLPVYGWKALAYGALFFVLINAAAWAYGRAHETPRERLPLPLSPTYGEIMDVVRAIRAEERSVVVFVGASAMWGAWGVEAPAETVPLQVQSRLGDDVAVYNLAFPSLRPLDQYALLHLLKDDADVFVADINPQYFAPAYDEGVTTYRDKYLRVKPLLTFQRNGFYAAQPAAVRCLEERGLEFRQEFSVSYRWLPLVRYKTALNEALFNRHASLVARDAVDGVFNALQGEDVPWREIVRGGTVVRPPAEPAGALDDIPSYRPSLNSCLTRALAGFVRDESVPVVWYLTPLNPEVVPLERYGENVRFVRELFGENEVADFSYGTVPAEDFIDMVHMKPAGHAAVAGRIADVLKREYGF